MKFMPYLCNQQVRYNSKTDHWSSPANTLSPDVSMDMSDSTVKLDDSISVTSRLRGGVKKANLYAWLSLQSLPEVDKLNCI